MIDAQRFSPPSNPLPSRRVQAAARPDATKADGLGCDSTLWGVD